MEVPPRSERSDVTDVTKFKMTDYDVIFVNGSG